MSVGWEEQITRLSRHGATQMKKKEKKKRLVYEETEEGNFPIPVEWDWPPCERQMSSAPLPGKPIMRDLGKIICTGGDGGTQKERGKEGKKREGGSKGGGAIRPQLPS